MFEDSRFEHTQIPSWDSLEHRDCLHTSKHMMQQTTEDECVFANNWARNQVRLPNKDTFPTKHDQT